MPRLKCARAAFLQDRRGSRRTGGGRGPQAAGAARGAGAGAQAAGGRGASSRPGLRIRTRNGVWRSDDKGKTWRIVSNNNNRPMYYSQIRVDPGNDQIVYTGGASFYKSVDGGKTFATVQGIAHSDHHALWINPKNGNHLINGNDGGLDVTYDQCATWEFINTMAVGQFYKVGADMRKPYYIYGGLQDNGSWGGPSATRTGGITNADWFRVGGGDGFYCVADPTDFNTIYTESQNGAISRYDLRDGPQHEHPAEHGGQGPRRPAARSGTGAGRSAASGPGLSSGGRQYQSALAGRRAVALELEHPHCHVAVQSAHHIRGGQQVLQVRQPRRHLDCQRGSDQADRPQHSPHHGSGRRPAHVLQE